MFDPAVERAACDGVNDVSAPTWLLFANAYILLRAIDLRQVIVIGETLPVDSVDTTRSDVERERILCWSTHSEKAKSS